MNKKINICVDFMKTKKLSKWHNDRITKNFFNCDAINFIKWDDIKEGENNFVFLQCVPNETIELLELMPEEFYKTLKNKKIKLLFQNEQFNLFMFNENIFKYNYNIKHNCYDINDILYWKIKNNFKKYNIGEENFFFIHNAKGFLNEVKQMKERKILWINSTLNLESKHLQYNNCLTLLGDNKVFVEKFFFYHYACLFRGRPAIHRHNLIKKLWSKNILNFGKCSLTPWPEEQSDFKLIDLPPHGQPNAHNLNEEFDETNLFKDIFVWIAGETYCPNGYPYFTEKTIKAILYERPFISYGNPGTLAYLRDYGFKTFGAYWDESYDDEKDDDKKIEMIANIIQGICEKSILEINRIYDDMKPILEHNKNLLIKTDWRKELVNFLNETSLNQ